MEKATRSLQWIIGLCELGRMVLLQVSPHQVMVGANRHVIITEFLAHDVIELQATRIIHLAEDASWRQSPKSLLVLTEAGLSVEAAAIVLVFVRHARLPQFESW
jgi:hypothetical protein